jgi:hypothetical protein
VGVVFVMISISGLKPELEIPQEIWDSLEFHNFVNFPVPLLNPPTEIEGRLEWSGLELMMISSDLAAFARDEDAERYIPYDEMFRVVPNIDSTRFAQIYSVFFERTGGEWRMIYRLMNCDRALDVPEAASGSHGSLGEDEPLRSNWMLSLSGVENWLTLDAYLNYYCKYESYNKSYVASNIREQLEFMEGSHVSQHDARVMPLPNGVVVLVSKLTRGLALVVDVVKNTRLARFVMDDPPHLVELFWRLNSKMFLSASDRMAMGGMICDARHYLYAIKSAREQRVVPEEITAAAFYC